MAKPKLALIPAAIGTKLYSVLPSNGSGDFTFTRGSAATRINAQGLIESVANTSSRLNYPLLDGKVVGCPHNLLEPQRTNSLFNSQEIDNAYWFKSFVTITPNTSISPDGTLNADTLTSSSLNSVVYRTGITCGSLSFFAKDIDLSIGKFRISVDGVGVGLWNKDGTLHSVSGTGTATNGVDYGNGWFRFAFNVTSGNVVNYGIGNGSGSESILVFGLQNEPSATYSTSYIKTTTSATTRLGEVATGSGNSTTFNDSEGVLMVEIANSETSNGSYLGISNGSTAERLIIGNESGFLRVFTDVFVSGTIQSANKDFNKIAVKYNSSNTSIYYNGFLIISINQSANLSGINELKFTSGGNAQNFHGKAKQLQYFDSVLTDTQLEQLTSWQSFSDMAEGQLYTIE